MVDNEDKNGKDANDANDAGSGDEAPLPDPQNLPPEFGDDDLLDYATRQVSPEEAAADAPVEPDEWSDTSHHDTAAAAESDAELVGMSRTDLPVPAAAVEPLPPSIFIDKWPSKAPPPPPPAAPVKIHVACPGCGSTHRVPAGSRFLCCGQYWRADAGNIRIWDPNEDPSPVASEEPASVWGAVTVAPEPELAPISPDTVDGIRQALRAAIDSDTFFEVVAGATLRTEMKLNGAADASPFHYDQVCEKLARDVHTVRESLRTIDPSIDARWLDQLAGITAQPEGDASAD